ncbi:class III extradiol ring-cleavage dioxygenase family protein [Salinactinospora qingdaonensis]|uniref:Catalytic LigB subunit of aromatic ring-opening dioxygenase n=1 Tax=Salinactinospora qingdaonensis TaxID=702744 RepID=A0ABP7FQW9_9ACTN
MIIGAAVCPHPPVLLRELAGQHDTAAPLRRACTSALTALLKLRPEVIVVVGGAATSGVHHGGRIPVREFGGAQPDRLGEPALPLSLGVGRRLLDETGAAPAVELIAVEWEAASAQIERLAQQLAARPERIGLLVMGDGSARRGSRAPGYVDERAIELDKRIGAALATGDAAFLSRVEPHLATELLVAGRAAFAVLGSAVTASGASVHAETHYADDPLGVMYFVVVWVCAFS